LTGPSAERSGTASRSPGRRRWAVGTATVLAGLIAAVVVTLVLDGRRSVPGQPVPAPLSGSVVPVADLAGEWSGQGFLDRCAGFDEGCPHTRSVTLTIDCSTQPCLVTPFDRSYGSPPLLVEDGSHRAVGPVPPDVAPVCDGVPTASASWRLDLTVRDGRLVGSYAESSLQSFDCGGTGVSWDVVLSRG
jgi:hypothetical protein